MDQTRNELRAIFVLLDCIPALVLVVFDVPMAHIQNVLVLPLVRIVVVEPQRMRLERAVIHAKPATFARLTCKLAPLVQAA